MIITAQEVVSLQQQEMSALQPHIDLQSDAGMFPGLVFRLGPDETLPADERELAKGTFQASQKTERN